MAREIVVLVTTKNLRDGRKIAGRLVGQKLAACVNVVPRVESVFLWKGKICKENEALLVIKTRGSLFPRLEREVKKLHRYTVPEVIALPIGKGSRDYLAWIRESTR